MSAEAALAKKKHVRAGHRGSTTRSVQHAEEELRSARPDVDKLSQLKLTLKEKLDVLKHLDEEILDSMSEADEIAAEIE